MRFHIPGLAHTQTTKSYNACAYTMKVYKLCKMLHKLGHTVYHYGVEGSDPICTENISVATQEEQKKYYPEDYKKVFFKFDISDEFHQKFYVETSKQIKHRMQSGDFLLCAWGHGHKPIADLLDGNLTVVESGIGYIDTFANFRVFESYNWMSYIYGKTGMNDGSFYDCVIPNFFDPDDFEYRSEKEDWFLYFGRLTKRKGVDIAAQVTEALGVELVCAGQGSLVSVEDHLNITSPHVKYVGHADVDKRKYLMSRAKGIFTPTYYIEPFGGVTIEAAMSGTPVLTTDWGVFPETIVHGTTGFRCRTFEQFCWAAKNIDQIKPSDCRKWAVDNFSCDRVAMMYQEYFEMLSDLHDRGWYQPRPNRANLDWLRRKY